ncbi:MAG: hypothetical protein E6J68_14785 [Deltaproteobacteria bacterium]|nr:MAG: hypothetical protein E6J68_14785 [Deltaproteobacteria bacterium]
MAPRLLGRLARSLESRWWLVAIVALATTLRAAHVLSLRATPWFDHLVVDPEYYDEWARRLAAGGWLGERPFYMDPLYPYFLGVIYRLCGRDLLLVRLVQVALGAGSCALVAVIGRRVGGAAIGALAALGFALYKLRSIPTSWGSSIDSAVATSSWSGSCRSPSAPARARSWR